MRLVDGLDLAPHPQDVIDAQGTPLGDELLMMQLDANAHIAMGQLERERAKGIWGLFRWLFR